MEVHMPDPDPRPIPFPKPKPHPAPLENDFASVIARSVLDVFFREKLLSDPVSTIKLGGYRLSKEEISAIKKLKIEDWEDMKLKDLNTKIDTVMDQKVRTIVVEK